MQATVPLDLSVGRPMLERLGDQLPVVLSLNPPSICLGA